MNTPETPADSPTILEANLRALEVHSPGVAARIRSAPVREDMTFSIAQDGALTAVMRFNGQPLHLCSARRPLEEASGLAGTFDPKSAAAAIIIGFGLGHHVKAVADTLRGQGAVIVIEPDLSLLRTVLGRIDCSGWMITMNVRVHTDIEDQSSVSRAFEGVEGMISIGMKMIEHPASRTRLAPVMGPFLSRVATVVGTVRTHIITTLCQVGKTVGHYLSNASTYAAAGGVEDLKDSAIGRPAVVVSAGPSFARNVDLLKQPGIRDRVVIIAAQTVLKPLLARGIKPHFVTALDHADISKRFFEGLTAEDVRGVTMVIEPKAHPAIPAAFPGEIRCVREAILDDVLGPELTKPMGALPSGSTVAHLSYYLARHMGCDPVILVGQDLGFTDGQYYAAGAAIHQIWSGELSAFNTLEMLEWQRIVRMKRMLHRASDHLGRDVYTDEQMLAYRLQFEREFGEDRAKGLRVVDATEGGVRKEHTSILTLAEALDAYAGPDAEPWTPPAASPSDTGRAAAVLGRLRQLREDAHRLKKLCAETDEVLTKIIRHAGEHHRVNPLVTKAQEIGQRAEKLGVAYRLVQYINQTGQLKRFRRDRLIALDASADPVARQKRQVERDRENMRWLSDAADELITLTDRAIDRSHGLAPADQVRDQLAAVTGTPGPKARARVGAVLAVNTTVGGLDSPRDLSVDLAGKTPLAWTVTKLLEVRNLDTIVIATAEEGRVRELLGDLAGHPKVRLLARDADPLAARRRSIAAGRRWTSACWRGGLGDLSVFDEAFSPAATLAAMDAHRLDAAVIVGADWPLIDASSLASLIDRYRAAGGDTGSHQLMFVHAAPGLAGCLIEREPVAELAHSGVQTGPFASIGAMIGYLPFAPQLDPIGKPAVIAATPAARDLGVRCVADSPWAIAMLNRVLTDLPANATLDQVASAVSAWTVANPEPIAVLNIDTAAHPTLAARAIADAAAARPSLAVTITGADDPLATDAWRPLAETAHKHGAMVHLRTRLDGEAQGVTSLREAGVEIVSVDLLTTDRDAYTALTGRDTFEQARSNTDALVQAATIGPEGLPDMWVVPRITRRDSEYGRIEAFYDEWLMKSGACVIDPLPAAIAGERIAPLPIPAGALARMTREEGRVCADGAVLELKSPVATEAA